MRNEQGHCEECGGYETVPEGECNKCKGGLGTLVPEKGDISEEFEKIMQDIANASKKEAFAATAKIPTVNLPFREYEYISSQIATHMSKENKRRAVVTLPIANYEYTFENRGFGNYRIIDIKEIK